MELIETTFSSTRTRSEPPSSTPLQRMELESMICLPRCRTALSSDIMKQPTSLFRTTASLSMIVSRCLSLRILRKIRKSVVVSFGFVSVFVCFKCLLADCPSSVLGDIVILERESVCLPYNYLLSITPCAISFSDNCSNILMIINTIILLLDPSFRYDLTRHYSFVHNTQTINDIKRI